MSYPSTNSTAGNKTNTAPRIPPGSYVARAEGGGEISVGATANGTPQIGWRVTFYKRAGGDLVSVGSLINFRVITDNQTNLEITLDQLRAFGATNPGPELAALLRAQRKTLSGFGSTDADATLKYELYEGKQQPRMAFYGAKVKMKNTLSSGAGAAAASGIEAMLARMGQASSVSSGSTGAALPDFDGGDADAEDFGEDGNGGGFAADVREAAGASSGDDLPQF